jgi:DNA invertase Pin-like site-specific DNA recombinase
MALREHFLAELDASPIELVRPMTRAAIYLRVSTREQNTENQARELLEVAARMGHEVVGVYEDRGISGAKGRGGRPEFDRLLRDATQRKFDVVMAWSVDRLGRSLQDLVAFLSEIQALGIDLYLHRQQLDTSTPAGRAMFGMLGVFASFEREMIAERVRAGMTRARANGTVFGRPRIDHALERRIARAHGSVREIAKRYGIGVGTVHRIRKER